jgi:integrase
MSKPTQTDRLLPANVKAIQKLLKAARRKQTGVSEYRIQGTRGLVLHVLTSGTATWYVHYDVQAGKRRKRRKHKIGRIDEVSLADALRETERLRPLIRQGADPATEKVANRVAITFAELAAERLEKGDPLQPGTQRDYRLMLTKDVLPAFGSLPAKSVTRAHVIDVLDVVSSRGASRRADMTRNVISSIFAFGIDRGLVTNNPASGLRNRHDNQPRDVVATKDDIRRLWSAMDDGEAAMSPAIATIVRLALLTGLRRTEIAAARKDELDLTSTSPLLTIPRGRAKNRNRHRVPLSPQAATLFRQAIEQAEGGVFVFPGERGASHIASRSVSKAMERTRAKLKIKDITMHDLRRTAGTFMSQLGVPKNVRERILNHGGKRKGSITEGVYNLYEYDTEKRAALELWAEALDCIVQGKQAYIEDYHARLAKLHGTGTVCVG